LEAYQQQQDTYEKELMSIEFHGTSSSSANLAAEPGDASLVRAQRGRAGMRAT
jgi:hypothetical protein